MKIPGYPSIRSFANSIGMKYNTVYNHMRQGRCPWNPTTGNNKKHPLYSIWKTMKNRCNNKNNHKYNRYGGRGIKVCPRWDNNFLEFVKDMGPRPEGYTLDRIDNDGGKWQGRVQIAGKVLSTVPQEDYEQAVIDVNQLEQLYTEFITVVPMVKKG